jgi:signal transduction histidine kinase
MPGSDLVDRLAALPRLAGIPRQELEWLVAHGRFVAHEVGHVVGPKGERIEELWVVVSGHIAIRVDRGAGPRLGTELLAVHEKHFPELVYRCPAFTAHTVHTMLDRARNFNTSALQDEKMVSLGKLAAGLAHELNNPASATKRGASLLLGELSRLDGALQALSEGGLTGELHAAIERLRPLGLTRPDGVVRSSLDQADREEEIADWLVRHGADPDHAPALADTAVTIDALDTLAKAVSDDTLDAALGWLAARGATQGLAADIEHRQAIHLHGQPGRARVGGRGGRNPRHAEGAGCEGDVEERHHND